jgi:hypothetical protein
MDRFLARSDGDAGRSAEVMGSELRADLSDAREAGRVRSGQRHASLADDQALRWVFARENALDLKLPGCGR